MLQINNRTYVNYLFFSLYAIFFASLLFSFRAVCSISTGLILATGLVIHKKDNYLFFIKGLISPFFISCLLLFLLKCFSLSYTSNMSKGLQHIERLSGLVFIPMAVYSSSSFLNKESRQNLMLCFTGLIFFAALYCLVIAFFKFSSGAPPSVFFYHSLVSPFSKHAIQFSILLFFELLFLFESLKDKTLIKKPMIIFLISFFSIFLLLLSSKLILVFYLCYLFSYFLKILKRAGANQKLHFFLFIMPAALIIAVLITSNPISNRFKDIITGDINFIKQERFQQGDYFNGLQFRLLQWRYVPEILNETNSWMLGLSPGDAQAHLDQKYIDTNMYTGKPGTLDKGFLRYHTHNQFLQVLLQNGFLGLIAFLFICYSLIKMMVTCKNSELSFMVLLLLVYSFTDAVLESQYGLIIFTFFPMFLYLSIKKKIVAAS